MIFMYWLINLMCIVQTTDYALGWQGVQNLTFFLSSKDDTLF